jgi:hypothetical protein
MNLGGVIQMGVVTKCVPSTGGLAEDEDAQSNVASVHFGILHHRFPGHAD